MLLDRQKIYKIEVSTRDDAGTIETMDTNNVTVSLMGGVSDYLEFDYIPYPAKVSDLCDYIELEEFMHEAMFRKMKQLLLEEKDPRDPMLNQLQNEYEMEIQKAKRDMREFDESGPDMVNNGEIEIWDSHQGYSPFYGIVDF